MGALRNTAILPMAMLALACGRSPSAKQGAMSEQLRSDLDRAAAPTADLASTQFRATRVVSAVELGNAGGRGVMTPRKAPVHRARPTVTPQVQPVPTVAEEPSPTPTVVAAAPAPAPTAGPRPAPNPVVYPGEGAGGMGPTGVIIRGGSIGDDDHCERHPGIPIMINTRIPMGIGIRRGMPSSGPRGIW